MKKAKDKKINSSPPKFLEGGDHDRIEIDKEDENKYFHRNNNGFSDDDDSDDSQRSDMFTFEYGHSDDDGIDGIDGIDGMNQTRVNKKESKITPTPEASYFDPIKAVIVGKENLDDIIVKDTIKFEDSYFVKTQPLLKPTNTSNISKNKKDIGSISENLDDLIVKNTIKDDLVDIEDISSPDKMLDKINKTLMNPGGTNKDIKIKDTLDPDMIRSPVSPPKSKNVVNSPPKEEHWYLSGLKNAVGDNFTYIQSILYPWSSAVNIDEVEYLNKKEYIDKESILIRKEPLRMEKENMEEEKTVTEKKIMNILPVQ